MIVSKVKKHNPGYPSKEETLNNPMLLKRVPKRWKSMAVICTALSAAALSSCSHISSLEDLINLLIPGSQTTHTSGAIMIPQYTLSEGEAVRIICEEASLQGLQFDTENTAEIITELPVGVSYEGNEYEYSVLMGKLKADGTYGEKNVSFEYISDSDFLDWTGDPSSGDESYRNWFMTEYFSKQGKKYSKTENGEIIMMFQESRGTDAETAEENLREQVRAFIDMLRVQEII